MTRWDDSVRLNASLTVADGTLNIPLTNSDIYQTTNTTPNIVLQDLPGGAFVATTKVTLNATKGYQQAGLIIYGDDNNYLKLVYSGRSTAAAGSKAANVIQFAKEVNATAIGVQLHHPRRDLPRHRVAADVEHRRQRRHAHLQH